MMEDSIHACEMKILRDEAEVYKSAFEAEISGKNHLRRRYGALPGETFSDFIARLAGCPPAPGKAAIVDTPRPEGGQCPICKCRPCDAPADGSVTGHAANCPLRLSSGVKEGRDQPPEQSMDELLKLVNPHIADALRAALRATLSPTAANIGRFQGLCRPAEYIMLARKATTLERMSARFGVEEGRLGPIRETVPVN